MDAETSKSRSASLSDLFHRSGSSAKGEEEEEEEVLLKWAALEKLPTISRARTSIVRQALDDGTVSAAEVDLTTLGAAEKKKIIDDLLKFVDRDHERLLCRLRDRIDRVGIVNPTIEVRFEDLSVEGGAYIGRRGLPTLPNAFLNTVQEIFRLSSSKKRISNILCGLSGIVKPARCLLRRVMVLMELVELNLWQDALVGLPGVDGLSTEQRKRLTIAVELVANPSIIYMDEPTTGLDARAAAIVLRTVRNTVDTGRTVVCTIHQPSIDIFEALDELLLLKRGGQVTYAGALGHHSHKLIEYFEAIPGIPKIKDGRNPAAWALEISSPYVVAHIGLDLSHVYSCSSLYQKSGNYQGAEYSCARFQGSMFSYQVLSKLY